MARPGEIDRSRSIFLVEGRAAKLARSSRRKGRDPSVGLQGSYCPKGALETRVLSESMEHRLNNQGWNLV